MMALSLPLLTFFKVPTASRRMSLPTKIQMTVVRSLPKERTADSVEDLGQWKRTFELVFIFLPDADLRVIRFAAKADKLDGIVVSFTGRNDQPDQTLDSRNEPSNVCDCYSYGFPSVTSGCRCRFACQ